MRRIEAELRGPKTPFLIDKDGRAVHVVSTLEENLRKHGYMIRDNRIDLLPQQIAHLHLDQATPSHSPS